MTTPKIFICYRREDSAYPAHQIYGVLANHFGPESVVFDVDTIPLGIDFREYLNKEVSKCDILLAVIGDQWIELLKQRIDEPNDYVRIEIQAALERDIPVVPVLVGKASVPLEKNLPTELAKLAYRNAAEVRAGRDLQTHLKRLIGGLDGLIIGRKGAKGLNQREANGQGREHEKTFEEAARQIKEEQKVTHKRAEVATRNIRKILKQKGDLKREEIPKTYKNFIGMEFVLIPAGNFMMGSYISPKELARKYGDKSKLFKREHPLHNVTINEPFYLQTTAVTLGQWKKVMGHKPSSFKELRDDYPVKSVSWENIQKFINKLNEMEGTDKFRTRLPTESEWEYACRAGSTTEYSYGDDIRKLHEYAWYRDISEGKNHPVGQKKPNVWGLYDMHGHVWEWVEDDQHENYNGAPGDGRAWIDDPRHAYRVVRGGSWIDDARRCRSAIRRYCLSGRRNNRVGFRLARSVVLGS